MLSTQDVTSTVQSYKMSFNLSLVSLRTPLDLVSRPDTSRRDSLPHETSGSRSPPVWRPNADLGFAKAADLCISLLRMSQTTNRCRGPCTLSTSSAPRTDSVEACLGLCETPIPRRHCVRKKSKACSTGISVWNLRCADRRDLRPCTGLWGI